MRDMGNMRKRWTAIWAGSRSERGAAMAEYTPLLAVIAFAIFFSYAIYIGPRVYENLIDASIPFYGDAGCPEGQWDLTYDPPKAHGVDRDINDDGAYCIKTEANPGNGLPGNGNTGGNSDVKDNNRPNP